MKTEPLKGEFYRGDGVYLYVRITPNAPQNSIKDLWSDPHQKRDRLIVTVTSPPDKGKANDALINLLAKTLKMPKSCFLLVSGHTARLKTIKITPPEKEQDKLANWLQGKGLLP